MIIAIDGPAASGKGTLGKRLAAHYGLRHLDTGLIYRAVAKALLDGGHSPGNRARAVAAAEALDPTRFDEPALKTPAVGGSVRHRGLGRRGVASPFAAGPHLGGGRRERRGGGGGRGGGGPPGGVHV